MYDLQIKQKKNRENKGESLLTFPSEYVVFDIETTGLDTNYDEIIEIGALKVKDEKIIDKFSYLIKPTRPIDEFITELTGITNEMVENAPCLGEVFPNFLKFIGDSILVGHNINFDINFVYDNLINLNYSNGLSNDFVDTLRLSRRILKNLNHHRLQDLAEYYNVNTSGSHRSLKDCEITNLILGNLKNQVIHEYGTIEAFLEACKKNHYNFRASDISTTKVEFDETNVFYDKYVAITGTLERIARKDAMQIIADLGGHCEDGVTKKTNFLILGNNDYNPILRGNKSSKLIKAEQMKINGDDIEIISENVFYDIVSEQLEQGAQNNISLKTYAKPADITIFNETELTMYQNIKDILIKNEKNVEDIRCNINSNNNFCISLFGEILRVKLRGKKNYIVMENEECKKYNFSSFITEPSTSGDGGDIRIIIDKDFDWYILEKYIIDKYDYVKKCNEQYIKNVSCGQKNYNAYLKSNYK